MNPLKPGSDKYPTNQRLNVSLAINDNNTRWQRAAKKINDVIKKIPITKQTVPDNEASTVSKSEKRTATLKANNLYLQVNSSFELEPLVVFNELELMTNAARYSYALDSLLMDQTMSTIELILHQDLLAGSDFWTDRFFLNPYIASSIEDGTTDSIESAIRITKGTTAEPSMKFISVHRQLQSSAYQDRLKLAHGRVFESMKGLTAEIKSQLRVTLTEGVARGVGSVDLAGIINNRLGIGMNRAIRIARTEINNVYRTAYMDEAKELNDTALKDDDWEIKQAHRSALSPTTRPLHAQRHGTIHTMQQQTDWWSINSNSINCLCSTLDVLVNRLTGEVLQSKMIITMKEQKKKWFPSS